MNSHLFRAQKWKPLQLPTATLSVLLILLPPTAGLEGLIHAQATPPITVSGGLNTHVKLSSESPIGKVQYDITGGTRAGTNLFHSFGNFDVPNNNFANFLNDSGLATSSILGRVTGGNPSSIFGTIQTTGFGNANLFLMNPSGIVLGPTASLDVRGSVNFTTADYIKLADGVRFNTIPNVATDSLLSAAPISTFGFVSSVPAAISVQDSTLAVQPGQTLSLVGGNRGVSHAHPDTGTTASIPSGVTVTGGRLAAPGGQINIASVASSGEVSAADFMPTPGMTMGGINLSQAATLSVSGNAAGTVRIRGGQLVITDATITANTRNANGAPIAIDIILTEDLSVTDTRGAATITAKARDSGDAGEIRISAANIKITSTADSSFASIDTHTSGSGKGGDVTIIAPGKLTATGGLSNQMYFVDSGTAPSAEGTGGSATITAGKVELTRSSINTGDFIAQQGGENSPGPGGNVLITADTFHVTNSTIATDSSGGGKAGGFTISARDVHINDFSLLQQTGINGTGTFFINATDLLMSNSAQIISGTALAPGGDINITANAVELKNGSTIQNQTFGDGPAGDIRITAFHHLTLSDDPTTLGAQIRPSGLFTNSLGGLGTLGKAGAITVTTPQLVLTDGARIDTTTQTKGQGGDATIITTDSISISGERPTPVSEIELFGLGSSRPSGIFTRTVGQASNSGSGGNITLTAGQSITINDGATISAGSAGPGNAGNIFINAGQQLEVRDSPNAITTEAAKASGGNIDIRAIDRIRFVNSSISTSVLSADGSGGNIFIDPKVVILEGSNVTAEAVGGPGGNITFVTPLFLADSVSTVSASSEHGPSGTVTIQSPTANLSGAVGQLASKTSPPQVLLQNRCVALAGGEQSTFILTGRNTLPVEPGGWLSSPVSMEHWTGVSPEHASTIMVQSPSRRSKTWPAMITPKSEANVLSLRRLTPPDFLVRAFATPSTGCPS